MTDTVSPPITAAEARKARTKNIIELCLGFSAMTRVFAKGSEDLVLPRLEEFVAALDSVQRMEDFEPLHAEFCDWFTRTLRTAPKQYKNGGTKPSCACSYGQAAKVLDVAAKVYVHYCGLPSPEGANRLLPLLHAALDTHMMDALGVVATLQQIGVAEYQDLQRRVARAIGDSNVHPVEFDDVMWRRLNRTDARQPTDR